MKALVVGGSSGIGAAVAQMLLGSGHVVATAQRRDPDMGHHVHYQPLDLRWGADAITMAVERAAEHLGGLDALVVSGGVGAFTPPRLRDSGKVVEEIARTNDLGARLVFLAAFGWVRDHAREAGMRAVYVGSASTRNRATEIEHYAASKAAAEKFWLEAGRRYAKYGVRANVVEAGWTEGPMIDDLKPEYEAKIKRSIPLHRYATREEVAEAVCWVLHAPDYMTANRLQITGGL